MRKILQDDEFGTSVFAHVLDDGTIDILRDKRHRFTIIGESFTLIGTHHQGTGQTIVRVKNGKLLEEDLKFKGEKEDEEEPTPDSKDRVKPAK